MLAHERLLITISASLLALAVSLQLLMRQVRRSPLNAASTFALTCLLLLYYQLYVFDPAHGMAILILPVATAWLCWRFTRTGRPAIAPWVLLVLQVIYALLYLGLIRWQEH